jgi:hypothetical protein
MRLAIIVVRILSSNEELRFQEKECLSPNKPLRFKSRLVAKGFSQIADMDYNYVLSPVVKHSSIRAFLALWLYMILSLSSYM